MELLSSCSQGIAHCASRCFGDHWHKKPSWIEDVLLWRDPKRSGIVLGGLTVAYLIANYMVKNPVVVLATVLQVAVLACFLWNLIAGFLKKPGVPVPRVVSQGISEGEAKDAAARYAVYANKFLGLLERVIGGKDVILTLQIAGALYVVAKVAAVVSPLTLAYLGVLLLFSLPKLYELKKDEIDGHVAKARDSYQDVYSKHVDPLVKKIPRASTATTSQRTSAPSPAKLSDTADSLGAQATAQVKELYQ